ncbi:mitotic spindle assembly checkpoint protein MAD1-like [Elysia marginata]|uniref:Mitotic spindle assembly checkpoint protein MAD1-like n=1 Tax=Elysia marginata TaxID=1093978 RepID=A0AAV4FMZ6_9GAST|nr:mitotic spindle assembly checkpoint protein MAD1-like [Elysia marginata]
MDSFSDSIDSQLSGMKRKFDLTGSTRKDKPLRHNLLSDFDEADNTLDLSRHIERPAKKKPMTFSLSPTQTFTADSPSLSMQLNLKAGEIQCLKASITKLENRIALLQRNTEEMSIEHDKEIAEIKAVKDREVKKASDLKSKLQYVMECEKTARDEVHRLEKELQQQTIESNKKLFIGQKERMEANEKAQQAKAQWIDKEAELNEKIISQKHKINELQNKLEESLAESVLNKKSSGEILTYKRQIEELEESLLVEKKKVKDLEFRFEEHEDNIITTKALMADLELVPSLKSEVAKLRQDNEDLRMNEQSTLRLEEEIFGLKSKLGQIDSLREAVAKLEVENEDLKERLVRWEATDTSGSRRPQSPSSISRCNHELEITNASLLMSQGEMKSKLSICERKLEHGEAELHSLKSALATEKNTSSQLNDLVKRLKRKMLLLSKERDAYKNLLDSYESEVTVQFDAEKTSQIQRLEALVQEHKAMAIEAENEIESLSNQLAESRSHLEQAQYQLQNLENPNQQSSQQDNETITQLREQNAVLESELIKTQQERDVLDAKIEQRHLQGDYDPTKTKIIHFLQNPHALAQKEREEELEKLKEDNEKLKKRNQILEENGGIVEGLTMQVEENLLQLSPSKEIESLKSQLASAEKRNQRLKEVFSKTSKEFREVCYELTGYRFDIPCPNQYRLTSMYAERQKDHLLFQQTSQGEIQLLQTDFSMTFQDSMEKYLNKYKSLPLFLSHITMELFDRQTMSL